MVFITSLTLLYSMFDIFLGQGFSCFFIRKKSLEQRGCKRKRHRERKQKKERKKEKWGKQIEKWEERRKKTVLERKRDRKRDEKKVLAENNIKKYGRK